MEVTAQWTVPHNKECSDSEGEHSTLRNTELDDPNKPKRCVGPNTSPPQRRHIRTGDSGKGKQSAYLINWPWPWILNEEHSDNRSWTMWLKPEAPPTQKSKPKSQTQPASCKDEHVNNLGQKRKSHQRPSSPGLGLGLLPACSHTDCRHNRERHSQYTCTFYCRNPTHKAS